MKRFVYAAGAVGLTGSLVLLSMSIAQRDARVGDSTTDGNNLPYANQPAQPISAERNDADNQEFFAPIVRANDSDAGDMPLPLPLPPTNLNRQPRAIVASYSNNSPSPDNTLRDDAPPKLLTEPPALSDLSSLPPSFPSNGGSSLPPLPNQLPASPLSSPNSLSSPSPPFADERSTTSLPVSTSELDRSAATSNAPPVATFGQPTYSPSLPPSSPTSLRSGPSYPSAVEVPSATPPNGIPPQLPVITAVPSLPVTTPVPGMPGLPGATPSPNSFNNSPPSLPPNAGLPPTAAFAAPTQPSYNPGTSNSTNATSNALPAGTPKATSFSSPAPGVRQLDGSQNPSMEIQKRAPSEVQVGIPAVFTLLVRNVGNAAAFEVSVVDSVPKGAKLIRTSPQAQPNGPNGLVWRLGEMAAGSEQVLTVELVPETEGEIGSVASVNFAAHASVRTMSTQPKLVVKQLFEPVVLGGDSIRIMIEVANIGTGTARDVRLQEDVPANLRHSTGSRVLELSLGDLAPGETEKRDIELSAISAGKVANVLRVISENAATNESAAQIEVVSPKLETSIEGASLRYLERQVTYTVRIHNSGTAIATNAEITLFLPSGLQFNSTINQGTYLPSQHAVRWKLAELAAGSKAATEVTLLPVEEGSFVLRMQAEADAIRAEPIEKPVRVEGQSELAFTIEDDNDPIETDGKTTYLVKISNIGTRIDNNVELAIDLPEGSVVEQVDAPVDYKVSQRNVIFAPIAQMQAKDQQTIRVSVRHTREGTHVVRAQLKSKLRPVAVSKEESTQVYRDQ